MHDSMACHTCLRSEALRLASLARELGPCGCCEMPRPNPNQQRNALIGLLLLVLVAVVVTVAVLSEVF